MPNTVKQVKRLIGFVQFFRNFIPNLGQKLLPFFKLLRKENVFTITNDHHESLNTLKADLTRATDLTLRLAKPGLQFVILCDASFHGTGFVLMIEDYLIDKKGKTKKTYAPVSFGSRLFTTTQLKFSVYYKEFLALYFALDHFAHFMWCATKPVLVLTDNRSLTQFFQSKSIHPSLWNCLDRVLSFNILLAHIPGKVNSAADFLSRMQTDPNLTLQIKLTDHVPFCEIEIETEAKAPNVSLSNISEVAPFCEELQPAVDEQFITQLKAHGLYDQFMAKQHGNDADIHITGFFSLSSIPQVNLIGTNNFEDILNDLPNPTQPLDLVQEQQNDEVTREVVSWKNWGNPDESPNLPLALRKYRKQFNRLVVENDILYRLFYDDCGKVKYKQFCVPKTLWRKVVFRLHNSKTAGHFGIVKTVEEFRKRFYFPNLTEFFISSIKNCLTCLQLKRVPSKFLKTPLQPVSSLNSYPGETLRIDLVGPLTSSVHRYVLTAIDVFTKYLFAVPLTNVRADTIARELTSIFFRHSYLPKTIHSDLGTSFVSELLHELTKLLEIQLDHASLKHPQTVGVVERSHSALKRILKLNTNEQWNDWFKYVQLATFIHNTSYHSAIGCSHTVLFHGREPIKPLDLRFNNTLTERFFPNSEYVIALQDAMNKKFSETKFKLTEMYNKYRACYDCKAEAKPLALLSYCLLVNPKLTTQSDFESKSLPIWLPLYCIEKILTNSNYIIRKVSTNYTQCVRRIRLIPVTPQGRIHDLTVNNIENFQRDPSLGHYRGEPTLFDESIPSLLEPPTTVVATQNVTEDPPPVTVNIRFPIAPAPVPLGLAPRDYHEKVIQNKIPPKKRCIPITEQAASSHQLTKGQKRDVIIDSCQRTRTLQPNSVTQKDPNVHDKYTRFRHSAQSTPPGYSKPQKEVKKRYSLKNSQKRLSIKNDVNAVIESSVHPKFCFSQSDILTATTCIEECVSSDFAMGKGLASTIACCYPDLQELRKLPKNNFPPGSLVTYFDQQHQRFIYNLVTKRQFFQKPTYETLELSLQALKQHLKRHNIQKLEIPKLGCGYDQLHWPKVFSILFNVFSGSNLIITIFQPIRQPSVPL